MRSKPISEVIMRWFTERKKITNFWVAYKLWKHRRGIFFYFSLGPKGPKRVLQNPPTQQNKNKIIESLYSIKFMISLSSREAHNYYGKNPPMDVNVIKLVIFTAIINTALTVWNDLFPSTHLLSVTFGSLKRETWYSDTLISLYSARMVNVKNILNIGNHISYFPHYDINSSLFKFNHSMHFVRISKISCET